MIYLSIHSTKHFLLHQFKDENQSLLYFDHFQQCLMLLPLISFFHIHDKPPSKKKKNKIPIEIPSILTKEISNGKRKTNMTENAHEINTANVVIGCCRR